MSGNRIRIAVAGQALIEQPVDGSTAAATGLVETLRTAHIAATNFEGTLGAPHTWPLKAKTMHVATPTALSSLREIGFNALGLANNHAFDLGPPALEATRVEARARGFVAAGSGYNLADAGAPAMLTTGDQCAALFAVDLGPQAEIVYAAADRPGINPLRIRSELVLPAPDVARLAEISRACGYEERFARRVQVGYSDALPADNLNFFGMAVTTGEQVAERHYPDPHDLERILTGIRAAHGRGDLVVVSAHSHHWETNWAAAPPWLADLTRALVDAGADVVFCHGAPVLQGMTLHSGRPIFFGLGNLIFHTARAGRYDDANIDVWRSAIAICEFGAARTLNAVRIHPIRVGLPLSKCAGAQRPPAPELLEGTDADDVIDGFIKRSQLTQAVVERDNGVCVIRPSAEPGA